MSFQRPPRTAGGSFVRNIAPEESGESAPRVTEDTYAFLAAAASELVGNCISVFGLATLIVGYAWLFLGEQLLTASVAVNLVLTVVGLTVFSMGLRQGLMPLGEQVGARLPVKVPLPIVYLVIFVLGVLCTIAEPAIGTAAGAYIGQVLSAHAHGRRWGWLCCSLRLHPPRLRVQDQELRERPADPRPYCDPLLPRPPGRNVPVDGGPAADRPVDLHWASSCSRVTGLAWDCGAVTTGPVTVPIVLALGIGVSASTKSQEGGGSNAERETEERRQSIRKHSILDTVDPVADAPHHAAVTVGSELPEPRTSNAADPEADLSGFGIVTFASLFPVLSVWALALGFGGASFSLEPNEIQGGGGVVADEEQSIASALFGTCRAIVPLAGFLLLVQVGCVREPLASPLSVAKGLGMCFLGMFIFSFGLGGALVPLGQRAGSALNKAIERYGPLWGPPVILAFGFLSGVGATFSEPALIALGETVEKLTKGAFSKMKLIMAVALGVGFGIALGMAKVYFKLPLWIILVCGYLACILLTRHSDEVVTCIAWDSAGVTTGPVTVPIVLASGLSLGREVKVAEGFGILSCASIGPILMVLISGLLGKKGGAARDVNVSAARASGGEILLPELTPAARGSDAADADREG